MLRHFSILFLCCLLIPACSSTVSTKYPKHSPSTASTTQTAQPAQHTSLAQTGPSRVTEAVPVSDRPLISQAQSLEFTRQTHTRFFRPWQMSQSSLTAHDAFWGVRALQGKKAFSENLQSYPQKRWEYLVDLQNMSAFPSMALPAIITRNTALRVLPDMRPFFLDPGRPGEGFPFDYFQNSALWLGHPVLVVHKSMDDAWYYVESALANGWVKAEDLAFTDQAFTTAYKQPQMAAILRDKTSLQNQSGQYLGQAHLGTILPLVRTSKNTSQVLVPLRDAYGQARIGQAILASFDTAPMPVGMTTRAIAILADTMEGQQYGWGGLYENRDCSATLHDLFVPFGLWLPRNSSQQTKAGLFFPLTGFTPQEKKRTILQKGIPFVTLVNLPGHVALYLGTDKNHEILILHNLWGLRTSLPHNQEGRAVIGRLAITTLHPGKSVPGVDPDAFLSRVHGITVLIPPTK